MKKDANPGEEATYQIQLRGNLRESWSRWFEDATILGGVSEDGGAITTLICERLDQAALHGVLIKIRDLNLILIAVTRIEGQCRQDEENNER